MGNWFKRAVQDYTDVYTGGHYRRQRDRAAQSRQIQGDFESTHSIDPNTGELLGPPGSVPQEVGLKWQDMHNQAVWRQRERRIGAASEWGQNALGELQTFRPGGAAALGAGIYDRLAQISLQQAQLTEPLDLLGPYRENQAARARKDAKKAAVIQTVATLAGGALTLATGGAAAPLMAGLGVANTMMQERNTGEQERPAVARVGYDQPIGPPAPPPAVPPPATQPPDLIGPPAPGTGQPTPGGQPMQARQGAPGGGQPGTGAPGGGGGTDQPPQGGSGPPGQGAAPGAAPGVAAPPVGADGNFTSTAWAANAAQRQAAMPQVDALLLEQMIDQIENDPDWQVLDAMVSNQLALRGMSVRQEVDAGVQMLTSSRGGDY